LDKKKKEKGKMKKEKKEDKEDEERKYLNKIKINYHFLFNLFF
jgi:hypothetical protein